MEDAEAPYGEGEVEEHDVAEDIDSRSDDDDLLPALNSKSRSSNTTSRYHICKYFRNRRQ